MPTTLTRVAFAAVALAAAGSLATTRAEPAELGYEDILGNDVYEDDLVEYVTRHGCDSNGMEYTCRTAGTLLFVDDGGVVNQMRLYAPAAGGMGTYEGPLPYGLTWESTRADVERFAGQPGSENPAVPGYVATSWVSYPSAGFSVDYLPDRADGTASPQAQISHLQLRAW